MKRVNKFRGTSIKTNEAYTGEPLYIQLRIATKTKNPIKMDAPIIYTDKKEGVKPQYDIRTDKWEIAQNAMNYVNATEIAKGQQYTLCFKFLDIFFHFFECIRVFPYCYKLVGHFGPVAFCFDHYVRQFDFFPDIFHAFFR